MGSRLLTTAMTAAAAVVGSLGTKPDSSWYRGLDRPDWEPPPVAFPLVWTPLYGAIAWSTGRAADASPEGRGRYLGWVAADLALNAGWCWAFFTRESARGGLVTILALDAVNLKLLRETATRDKAAAAALAPYVGWTGFATALNHSIWDRNR